MINFKEILLSNPLYGILETVITNDTINGTALKLAEKKIHHYLTKKNVTGRPLQVQEDKFIIVRNMLYTINNLINEDRISKQTKKGLLANLLGNSMLGGSDRIKKYEQEHGYAPPTFITISPSKACNLKCKGCYADSSRINNEKLDFDIVDRILTEKKEKWGSFFTVISGGEPLMYHSQGKGILDLVEKHNDNFFLMYSNGTLIDEKTAERMAQLGNITPAISVEGLEKETDERRGKGVHRKILKAFQNLRDAGVVFGISVTGTKNNADLITSNEFVDYYFSEQGVSYCWIFQYMPIGRKITLNSMVTPEQRLRMYQREQKLLREKKIFLADFWNSGALSNGCIAAAREHGGYLYIDWNGDVMPCVFVPYSTHNIVDIYKKGGNLSTVIESPFFKEIRKWQREYSYMKPADEVGNQIVPCVIRDHHQVLRQAVDNTGAHPVGTGAKEALKDREYYKAMVEYGEKVAKITQPVWDKNYLEPEKLAKKNKNSKHQKVAA